MVAPSPEGTLGPAPAGVAGRGIALAHVLAGFEQHGEIGAMVGDERRAGFAAQARHLPGGFEDLAAPMSLVEDLQNAGAAFPRLTPRREDLGPRRGPGAALQFRS